MQIKVKVLPRSSKNEVTPLPDGSLKIKMTSPPIDGKANEKLIDLLSEHYHIAKTRFRIKSGLKSKNKVIEIV